MANQINLKAGGGVVVPPDGEVALFAESDGSIKKVDSAGTESDVGGGGDGDLVGWSNTLVGAAATIDVPIDGGDGLYHLEFEGTTAAGAAPNINLRFNGGALTTPSGIMIAAVGGGAVSMFSATDGRVYTGAGMGGGAISTISFVATISVRNGALCMYASQGEGHDGTTRVGALIQGRHSPGAALASLGLSSISVNFGAGSALRVKRLGA